MPLTQLDPSAALVVIDLQKGIVAMPTADPAPEVVDRAAQLALAFRNRGLPVVLVNVVAGPRGRTDFVRPHFDFPPDWSDLVPELGPHPGDILITKQKPGAFIGTPLYETLHELGVTQIFLAGIATSLGVESTARSAFDLGYNVVFIADAMTDRDPDSHSHCIHKSFPRLGEVCSTDTVLKALRA